jgi:small GTP-binding protein
MKSVVGVNPLEGSRMDNELRKKVILLGDGAVGKTSLIRRFVHDEFDDNYIFTIGAKVTRQDVWIECEGVETRVIMMIWDIMGQTDYHKTQKDAFKGASAAMLVCDLTRKETLDSLGKYWIPEFEKVVGKVPMVFMGNKADLTKEKMDKRDFEHAVQRMSSGSVCLETSAKTGQNVLESFEAVALQLVD